MNTASRRSSIDQTSDIARRRQRNRKIEEIVGAEGTVTDRVLGISIARDDLGEVKGPEGVTFDSDFQIHGDLAFQPLGADRAFFNGDLALRASEFDRVIDAI